MRDRAEGARQAHYLEVAGSNPALAIWILFHIVSPEEHSSNAMGAFLVQKNWRWDYGIHIPIRDYMLGGVYGG